MDNYNVKEQVFGDAFGVGLFHPDSTTKSEYELTGGTIGGKQFKRKVTILNRAEFEKTLRDLRLA